MGSPLKIPLTSCYVSTSNYYSLDNSNENLTMLGGSFKNGDTTVSLGVGNDCVTNFSTTTNKPAFEGKVKYNINDKLNCYARFQEIGGTESYRVVLGGSQALDEKNSVYYALHGTAKDNKGDWNLKTGGWIGFSHKCKNGISISAEVQQNIPLTKTTKSLGETLGSFNDSNKMISLFLTVPIN